MTKKVLKSVYKTVKIKKRFLSPKRPGKENWLDDCIYFFYSHLYNNVHALWYETFYCRILFFELQKFRRFKNCVRFALFRLNLDFYVTNCFSRRNIYNYGFSFYFIIKIYKSIKNRTNIYESSANCTRTTVQLFFAVFPLNGKYCLFFIFKFN